MKSIILSSIVIGAIAIMGTGCSLSDVGATKNSTVNSMNDASSYEINKTTFSEAQQQLGNTGLIFNKEDGKTKYVWTSRKTTLNFGSASDTTKSLVLTFDKNNILVAKTFGTTDDPDVAKMKADMLSQVNNGTLTTTDEAIKARDEALKSDDNVMNNLATELKTIGSFLR
jgi:hypothetical protein